MAETTPRDPKLDEIHPACGRPFGEHGFGDRAENDWICPVPEAEAPPAPSLQGKTPRPTPEERANALSDPCPKPDKRHNSEGRSGTECWQCVVDAFAAARAAALEEAARRQTALLVSAKHLLDFAERQMAGFPLGAEEWFAIRDAARREITLTALDLASSPAPAKRAETEPDQPEKETPNE